jgi:ubiquinone/menaquinone biosynthesis C-methylase UbiE
MIGLTAFEIARLLAEPGLPFLYAKSRRELKQLVRPGAQVLDVGGRRSPYTIGLPADVTIFDLPRQSEVQQQLGLGIDDGVLAKINQRRSNIRRVILGDMTRCQLPSAQYDGLVAVEVIEHVQDDDAFMAHAARVLKPGGWAYLTTPNGDYNPTPHVDHVRHYTRDQLTSLLGRHFREVRVVYGVATGKNHGRGLRSLDPRRPLRLLDTVLGNLRNHRESRGLDGRASRTAHLFAVART